MDENLLRLFAERYQSANDKDKSFSQMLRDRRSFVQGQENAVGDQARSSIVNGAAGSGVPINPVGALQDYIGYHTDNANKTAQLTQEGFGYGQQAQSALEALAGIISSMSGRDIQRQDFELKKKQDARADEEQQRKNFESGYNPKAKPGEAQGGAPAVAEVIRQGGQDLLSEAPDDKSRMMIAQNILKSGGVDSYRQTVKPSLLKQQIIDNVDSLLKSDTKSITGVLRMGNSPLGPIMDLLTGGHTQFTKATLDQLKGLLSLDNVKYLKGQGQVSDAERQLLSVSASKLNNPNLSDEDFKKVLTDVRKILTSKSTGNYTGGEKVGKYVIEEVK